MINPTVLIIGAGPTGLGLACGLRRQGISVRVVDGATGPVGTSRALGVQPRGVEVLIRLAHLETCVSGRFWLMKCRYTLVVAWSQPCRWSEWAPLPAVHRY
jgi:2-polyprenyl-6-methoxyphenol hydroxylase-like FAD-dependent oxidoreductase